MTKEELIAFEDSIVKLFHEGKLPYPIHFSGGNEDQLIEIFKKIRPEDWCFSTWRSHYHALLKGISPDRLRDMILAGRSMHIMDLQCRFAASSIVAGCCSIAAGAAMAIKRAGEKRRVWCFVGDAAEETGAFYEAVRIVDGRDLPCTFVIEDNNLSVDTPKKERYGNNVMHWPPCVARYTYVRKYPHVQTGKIVLEYM
jgi:pyruvate dehydrogenase E1 component alpha subunit